MWMDDNSIKCSKKTFLYPCEGERIYDVRLTTEQTKDTPKVGVVYVYHLVLMARTLAVLSQALHRLVDESNILLIDVESQQAQSSCSAATDTVQELKCLTH